jgi:hypothetical protein
MNKQNWLDEMLRTQFSLTGATRTITEYRDQDGATWYRLDVGEQPGPQVVATREMRQREICQTDPAGVVKLFWQNDGSKIVTFIK